MQHRTTIEKDHVRLVTRRASLVTELSWMDKALRANWKKLGGVGLVESEHEIGGKLCCERRYFIVSAGFTSADAFAHAVRAQWGVEAMHWVLDENGCRVHKGHGARNFSVVRKFALTALRNDTLHGERSLRRRRKLADRRSEYRTELLGLKPRQ